MKSGFRLSDERYKTNFKVVNNALREIDKLNGYYHLWYNREHTGRQIGFKAQEIQKVFPELVQVQNDKINTLSVNYEKMTVVLLQAVKELNSKVRVLSQIVKDNKAEMAQLKNPDKDPPPYEDPPEFRV